MNGFVLVRPVHQKPHHAHGFIAGFASEFVSTCANWGEAVGVMLGAPYRDLSVVHDLRLEQVIDRFVESRFHFAAGGVVDDIRIKWTRLVGDIHHRDHCTDHGVVI